jgi:uncharacterized protein
MTAVYKTISQLPRNLFVGLILFYKHVLSPIKNALLGPGGCCRFHPTCSEYAIQSLKAHGVFKGGVLSLCRLSKCQPFHPGGYDPVKPVTSRFQNLPEPESILDLPGNL